LNKLKRLNFLILADWQCQQVNADGERCLSRSNLDIHHLTYERIGEELPTDVKVLCRFHHIKKHGK